MITLTNDVGIIALTAKVKRGLGAISQLRILISSVHLAVVGVTEREDN